MKDAFGIVGALTLVVGLIAGLSIGGYYLYAFLAPKYEATRRDVMIESRAYNEGTVRELYRLKMQYGEATEPAQKATIAAAARYEFSIFPRERLPLDLQGFMAQVQQ